MSKKKHKIDWLNHSLEFLVVIIGILIAFQLNKLSSERSQKQIIKTHLIQIDEETRFNKRSFENSIEYVETLISKFDTVFALLRKKEDYDRINKLSLELLKLGEVYVRNNSYLLLTETGDFKFMKDFDKKRDIVDIYEYYKWAGSVDEISINQYNSDFYPYLKENFDLVNGTVQKKEIYESKLFLNILGAYYSASQNRLQKYKDCLIEINKYLDKEKGKR